jgi:hypothetical protein
VPRAAKFFFIPVVHNPSRVMGHVAAPELPSQEGIALSHGTRDSPEAPLSGRQSLEPWDTWQHRSSPQQGGEVRGCGTRGSIRAYLSKEVRFGVEGHVATPELTSVRRRCSGPWDTWRLWSPPQCNVYFSVVHNLVIHSQHHHNILTECLEEPSNDLVWVLVAIYLPYSIVTPSVVVVPC